MVQSGICLGDTHIFGLGSVDSVSEDPATLGTMGLHASTTIFAGRAARDAADQDVVALLEFLHARAGFVDDAHTFVAQGSARLTARDITGEDVVVGSAYCGVFH